MVLGQPPCWDLSQRFGFKACALLAWAVVNSPTDGGGVLNNRNSLSPVLGAGVRVPGVGRAGSARGLSAQRGDGRLLPGSSPGRPSVRVCVLISSYKDISPMGLGPPSDLILP